MKNIIGLILMIVVFVLSILGYLSEKEGIILEENVIEKEMQEKEEKEKNIDGHHEGLFFEFDFREGSVIEIENIEHVYSYLDPHETQNYEDLLTIIASYIPLCVNDMPKEFFIKNEKSIGNALSIYSLDEFIDFSNRLKDNGLTKDSIPKKIEIISIEQKGRLLNALTRVFYDNATLGMAHYIDYVYIGKEAYLFMYPDKAVSYEK